MFKRLLPSCSTKTGLSHDMRHVGMPAFFGTRSILENQIIHTLFDKNKDVAMTGIFDHICIERARKIYNTNTETHLGISTGPLQEYCPGELLSFTVAILCRVDTFIVYLICYTVKTTFDRLLTTAALC